MPADDKTHDMRRLKSMKKALLNGNMRIVAVAVVAIAMTCFTDASLRAAVHEVDQVGLEFVPAEITVAPGDTVRWNWSTGIHTVTSGANCVYDGIHFDEPLNSGHQTAEYMIPGDFSGVIDYFCMPHCALGMTGVITVESPCPADFDGDSDVDTADLLFLLAAWGTPDGDVDGDSDTDTADLLELLAAWGACM
jgi:plastocyanin